MPIQHQRSLLRRIFSLANVTKVIAVLLAILLVILIRKYNAIKKAKEQQFFWAHNQHTYSPQNDATSDDDDNLSFYEKLRDGKDVNILILGDDVSSWAVSEGGFGLMIANYLHTAYGSDVLMNNLSMLDNTAYSQYVRLIALDDSMTFSDQESDNEFTDYDLAILCCSNSESLSELSVYYESIIMALKDKYSKCSVISVLPLDQLERNETVNTISAINAHYNIPEADTFAAIADENIDIDDMIDNSMFLNEIIMEIYYGTIRDTIEDHIGESYVVENITPIEADARGIDDYIWISVANGGFERINDTTFTANISDISPTGIDGMIGVDYSYLTGKNKATIYTDGKEFVNLNVTFNNSFSLRYIRMLEKKCSASEEIKIIFDAKQQADGFNGIFLSKTSE